MKNNINKTVLEFLARKSPIQAIKSMEILADMKYPINDRYSFESDLESTKDLTIKELLLSNFVANDFPLLSIESGLEKYFDKFQPFPIRFPPVLRLPEDLPDFSETPSACEIYRRDFSPAAANCGCTTYVNAIRAGEGHLRATVQGIYAAQHYARTGSCR